MPRYDTADNILNAAWKQLGLGATTITDPYASTNGLMIQLVAMLETLGQKLVRSFNWVELRKEHTFNTSDGEDTYDLPNGFDRFLDETGWNRTSTLPLGGPVNSRDWQYLKARTATGPVTTPFRLNGQEMKFTPVPSAVETIAFEYITRFWVKVGELTTPTADALSASTAAQDTLYFDRLLLIDGLKLAFKLEKGFPADAALDAYNATYALVTGADGAAPRLSLDGEGRYLDNVPETGWAE